jgi:flagellar basal body-associated protein FliL
MENGQEVQAPVGGGEVVNKGVMSEAPKKKSKVGLLIGLIVGGVVLVGALTAVILLVILGERPDYEGADKIVAEMAEKRDIGEGDVDISAIMGGTADAEQIASAEAAAEQIKEIVGQLKNLTGELGDSTALKDTAVKAKYDDFIATSNVVLPKMEKLAKTIEVLVKFSQDFSKYNLAEVISGSDMEGAKTLTEAQIRAVFAPLKTVGVEELANFATDSEEIYVKLLNFFKKYGDAMSGNGQLSTSEAATAMKEYTELSEAVTDYMENWMEDDAAAMGEKVMGIDQSEIEEYFDKLEALQAEIKSKIR